jgi:3'-5' exoribonuclease
MVIQKQQDIKESFSYFISLIKNKQLLKTCQELYNYPNFWTHAASLEHHHNFKSGLILHTLEVADNANYLSQRFPYCNKDVLISAALWHDLAKIWEYEWKENNGLSSYHMPKFQKTDYVKKIHHISGSNAEFTAMAMKNEVDRKTIQEIQHCIISHHGIKDWGSPVLPESLEAIILHQSDMLSAMYPFYKEAL